MFARKPAGGPDPWTFRNPDEGAPGPSPFGTGAESFTFFRVHSRVE